MAVAPLKPWTCAGGALLAGLVGLGTACDTPGPPPDEAGIDAVPAAQATGDLDALALLARLSLDLRGRRPSLDELARIEADPDALPELVEEFLADEGFPERVLWIWNDAIHTAVYFHDYTRFGALAFSEWQALGLEPLRLVRDIAATDRPYSDIVTATAVPMDATAAAWWGLPHSGGSGEESVSWDDGRPTAGLLSSTALWNRYLFDITNRNRGRANELSRFLLCADFFDRDVVFDFALDESSQEALETAVHTEPACQGCHAALDPLASFLGGFTQRSEDMPLEQFRAWSQDTADWFSAATAPGYFGYPGSNLTDLGRMMSQDPRLGRCAVDRLYEGLVGDRLDDDAVGQTLALAFAAEGSVLRGLAADIVALDAYQAPGERTLTSEQLYATLVALTGWDPGEGETDGLKALVWSVDHRVLAGGTDDSTVLDRNRRPGVGHQVFMQWLGKQVARPALEADRGRASEDRVLFTHGDPDGLSGDQVAEQLAVWLSVFLSRPVGAEDPSVQRLHALWQAAEDPGDDLRAWSVALESLIRHPALVLY